MPDWEPLRVQGAFGEGPLRIQMSFFMIETVQYSRSPGRARRRTRLGHRQHYVTRPMQQIFRYGDLLIMHPEVYLAMRDAVERLRQFPPASAAS